MRAIVQTEIGGPSVFVCQDVSEPDLRLSDVLIRVQACGVCYHDVVVRNGVFRIGVKTPLIPGHEVSGVVEKVGPAIRRLKVGDRVCTVQRRFVCGQCRDCRSGFEVMCPFQLFMGDAGLNGGYSEFVAVSEDCVAVVPEGVDLDQAAIVACTVGTSLNAVRDVGKLKIGETVLITGASGGLGAHAVQIARACGAFVLAVASTEQKAEVVRDLGAHEVIVTPHGADFSEDVRRLTDGLGVDVAIDNVGTAVFNQIRKSLARHGRWVLVGALDGDRAQLNPAQFFTRDISLLSAVSCTRRQLEDALNLVRRGLVRPIVAEAFPLEQAERAHIILERSGVTGRQILKPFL